MKGQRIGYVRVSSLDQNLQRQLENIQVDKIFQDKASARDMRRPQLEAMLSFIRQGDTVVIDSMDRLARNLDHLRFLVREMTQKGVKVEFVKENLTFTNESSPVAVLIMSVMGAVAEFNRNLIRERQREGIIIAKRNNRYKGRKKALDPAQVEQLRQKVHNSRSKAQLAQEFGISRQTLYQYLQTESSP